MGRIALQPPGFYSTVAKAYRKQPNRWGLLLTGGVILSLVLFIYWAGGHFNPYQVRILNLIGINIGLGLSLNLINGFTGQFSLGHAGFMAVGAYTTTLLMMPPAIKQMNFFMMPLVSPLDQIQLPFLAALLLGGLLSALMGVLIGAPVLRLRGDYLAIATLGFSEIIRIVITNIRSVTNGALGLKGIPAYTNLWWSWGFALLTIFVMTRLIHSSYGRAFKAIREDEIAAEAMGIGLSRHKMLAFTLAAFLAGIGGGFQASLLTTIEPNMFRFTLTFEILLMVVLGGMGSITGTVIAATIVTILKEVLRGVEAPMNLGFISLPGIPGMRMVIFSLLLILVVLFYREGIMGQRELSWERLLGQKDSSPERGVEI
ncbi:MAG TPA: branched-chain amino acid ABC transporter permease [Firmicutes bacterium]|jgi:branched-chain amino acid transport system permease protein|nr:branched-chain amino acid ABC transporter permease [Bacillota bacterium]